MNDTDSQHIASELEKHKNYTQTDKIEDADLIIINTCSVREKPVSKLFSEIGQFNKKKKVGAKIGVCGCTASHLGYDIIKRAPYVDFVVGARNISKIKDVVDIKGSVEVSIDNDESTYEFATAKTNQYRASVNISVGCDKKCTYCIVPSTRGEEISIPPEMIVEQVKKSVEQGAVEVMLLGQNVNSYGKKSQRKIYPLKMMYRAKEWYVKSYCVDKDDFRIFKFNRILEIQMLSEEFVPMEYPKSTDKPKRSYNKISLCFPKEMAYRVYDEFEGNEIEEKKNGDLMVSSEMPEDNWLIDYLLSFGTQVTVIEPTYLKKILSDEAKKIYEKNKEAFENLQKELEIFKYKKEIEKLSDEEKNRMRNMIKEIK